MTADMKRALFGATSMSDLPPAHEHLETAEHVAHSFAEGGVKSAMIPLSITVMAVVAATFGSLETTAASIAVLARSDASIRQGEATDLWGYFQATSLKKHLYHVAAQAAGSSPDLATQAKKYEAKKPSCRARPRPRRAKSPGRSPSARRRWSAIIA
jgi:Domain of unknown function (DUF4337)